jgi:hypothetical protein
MLQLFPADSINFGQKGGDCLFKVFKIIYFRADAFISLFQHTNNAYTYSIAMIS